MKILKKIAAFSFFLCFSLVFLAQSALAYIDPSAMTFIVQVIAGIVIASGATFAFYFKRIARKLKGKKNDSSHAINSATLTQEAFENDAEFDDSALTNDMINDKNDKQA